MTQHELQNEIRHLPLKEKYQLLTWFISFVMLELEDRQAMQFEQLENKLAAFQRLVVQQFERERLDAARTRNKPD